MLDKIYIFGAPCGICHNCHYGVDEYGAPGVAECQRPGDGGCGPEGAAAFEAVGGYPLLYRIGEFRLNMAVNALLAGKIHVGDHAVLPSRPVDVDSSCPTHGDCAHCDAGPALGCPGAESYHESSDW